MGAFCAFVLRIYCDFAIGTQQLANPRLAAGYRPCLAKIAHWFAVVVEDPS
jgi:hypothetical protein